MDSSIVVWASNVKGARAECAERGRARDRKSDLVDPVNVPVTAAVHDSH